MLLFVKTRWQTQTHFLGIPLFFALTALFRKSENRHGFFCQAVLQGDEQYGNLEGGRFWSFHSAGVSIVNADTCRIEHDIRTDATGKALPESWSDGVYMEQLDQHNSNNQNKKREGGYVFIHSGVTTYDEQDQAMGEIMVFSTHPKNVLEYHPVQARVPLPGGGGWHSYAYGVYTRNEFWALANGKLFVIHLDDFDKVLASIELKETTFGLDQNDSVVAGAAAAKDGILGQILWDESPHLRNYAYVTLGGDSKSIYIVDLESKQKAAEMSYASALKQGECQHGAHSMAYSNAGKRLYMECGWRGPTLEFDLGIFPTLPRFVAKHNISGYLYEEESMGYVMVSDKHRNQLHFLKPPSAAAEPGAAKATGEANGSSIEYQVDVPGHPDMASFYTVPSSANDGRPGTSKTIVCMPLTENVNRNNMDTNGNVVCDIFSCGPPQSPQDVAAGMCLYDASDNNKTLLRAPLSDFEKVANEEAPYGNGCPRCKSPDSYRGGDVCTCTPHCGSCASPDYDVSRTGVRCFQLEHDKDGGIISSSTESTLIAGAGAVEQAGPSFWNVPCSFGWTHRSSKRGGKYHVSVAHFPSNSLQIVDMSTQQLKCQVDLPGKPDTVLYVPPQPNQQLSFDVDTNKKNDVTAGVIMALVVCIVTVIVTVLAVFFFRRPYWTHSSGGSIKDMDELEGTSSAWSDNEEVSPLPQIT